MNCLDALGVLDVSDELNAFDVLGERSWILWRHVFCPRGSKGDYFTRALLAEDAKTAARRSTGRWRWYERPEPGPPWSGAAFVAGSNAINAVREHSWPRR